MLVIVACGLATFACSGAHPQDVLGDQATSGNSTSSNSSSSSSSASSSGGNTSSGASGNTSGINPGTSSGSVGGCTPEKEPNDSRDQANEVAPSVCGTVSRRDARDFLTFVLKPATKTYSLNFSGEVRLRVDVDGQKTVELVPSSTGVIPPFAPGKRYTIEVTPLNDTGNETKYSVTLVESG